MRHLSFEDPLEVLFLFNPFSDALLKQILPTIGRCMAREEKAFVVYVNPIHGNVLVDSGAFAEVRAIRGSQMVKTYRYVGSDRKILK